MKIKKFWNADKVVSITALLVGVGSLFVIVYQTNLIRQEQHASVLPYLQIYFNQSNNKYLKLNISNTGLGPALIKEVKVHYQGKKYDSNISSFYNKNYQYPGPLHLDDINVGDLIPAENNSILIGGDTTKNEGLRRFFSSYDEADTIIDVPVLEIIYTSIYDETWVVSMESPIPKKLDD